MLDSEILSGLSKAIARCDVDEAIACARASLASGVDPRVTLQQGVGVGISAAEKAYEQGQAFLPDLMAAAEAMVRASEVLEEALLRQGERPKYLGTVVLGTVRGDVHNIGKAILATRLRIGGFQVHDLGVDVSVERFVEAAREFKPQILGMSVLLGTSLPVLDEVIAELARADLRSHVKVMVGGTAVTDKYARRIGADAYGEDAKEAMREARRLLDSKGANG